MLFKSVLLNTGLFPLNGLNHFSTSSTNSDNRGLVDDRRADPDERRQKGQTMIREDRRRDARTGWICCRDLLRDVCNCCNEEGNKTVL